MADYDSVSFYPEKSPLLVVSGPHLGAKLLPTEMINGRFLAIEMDGAHAGRRHYIDPASVRAIRPAR